MSNMSNNIDKQKIQELLDKAKQAIKNSYSPYSKIRVASIVLTDKGTFSGVNIENASYGLTMCAERVAIFKAISEGAKKFFAILIYSQDIFPYPCGACRQVMSEFFDDTTEIIIASDRKIEIHKFSELFPFRFKI